MGWESLEPGRMERLGKRGEDCGRQESRAGRLVSNRRTVWQDWQKE